MKDPLASRMSVSSLITSFDEVTRLPTSAVLFGSKRSITMTFWNTNSLEPCGNYEFCQRTVIKMATSWNTGSLVCSIAGKVTKMSPFSV
jgi:hypothetical protein